ncbi:hypothetical protein NPIL_646111 [Nephila pilipes]|uniref:Uncharacterized protein n=1 Tax=Nephila pilipes TaxID=299642 RepID=A0A8X6PXD6_NEPPI|nr:hypothetical protein NPIL_646111 [Nephila pilipes]
MPVLSHAGMGNPFAMDIQHYINVLKYLKNYLPSAQETSLIEGPVLKWAHNSNLTLSKTSPGAAFRKRNCFPQSRVIYRGSKQVNPISHKHKPLLGVTRCGYQLPHGIFPDTGIPGSVACDNRKLLCQSPEVRVLANGDWV